MELLHRFPKIPKTQKLAIVVTISLIFFTIVPLLTNPTFFLKQPITNPSPQSQETVSRQLLNGVVLNRDVVDNGNCDIFTGEWVPNPQAPYYTNTTCWAIHEHQNCMKFGRPDPGFMRWRWKPDRCDMPLFNPFQFLEIVRGKSMAFVGDSVSRNHMQSLICLLSRVEYPVDVSYTPDENFKRWKYETYNFTIAMLWTPFLIKYSESDPNGPDYTGLFNLYLDEVDEQWRAQIGEFDYAIVSSGHWHYRPSIFFENRELVGCHYCQIPNMKDLTMFYGYRKAFRTAFRAILDSEGFKGVMYLRTFAPPHFEGGLWNKGGNCLRQRPFRSNETAMDERTMELYLIQMEEFRAAEREARERELRLRLRLMDTTQAMWLRPDGHPSRYGHPPNANVSLYNDCVHWCLPGPIDSWNDFLLHMLKKEGKGGLRDERARVSDRKMLF